MALEIIQAFTSGLDMDFQILDTQSAIVDLTHATVMQYHFQKPDGTMLVVDATRLNSGTDGFLTYSTAPNDLDQPGLWKVQVKVVIGPETYWSPIGRFKVKSNLPLES
jgi:hypothetical protein